MSSHQQLPPASPERVAFYLAVECALYILRQAQSIAENAGATPSASIVGGIIEDLQQLYNSGNAPR